MVSIKDKSSKRSIHKLQQAFRGLWAEMISVLMAGTIDTVLDPPSPHTMCDGPVEHGWKVATYTLSNLDAATDNPTLNLIQTTSLRRKSFYELPTAAY